MESLLERLKAAVPGNSIVAQELLDDYDSYYYSRSREAPLPVLRVKFADPLETWVYAIPRERAARDRASTEPRRALAI